MYYTYMIRCMDNSLYTGITTDIERRFNEHSEKDEKGAKYTKSHDVIKLVAVWETQNRSDASKLEYRLKHLAKSKKEEIIKDNNNFNAFLGNKLKCDLYKRINI